MRGEVLFERGHRESCAPLGHLLRLFLKPCLNNPRVISFTACAGARHGGKRSEKSGKTDAVIMDLTIPGKMGGLDASAAILALDPTADLIVSSRYSNDPVLSNFRHYGFFDSPAKPFRVEDLDGALRRVLDARCRHY